MLQFCIRKNKFKNRNICDSLILKKVQNNISPSKAEISYYSVCIFQNAHVFYKGWRYLNHFGKNLVFLDLWHTLYKKKSNLRNCILNESKWQDSFLLIPNNIPVILRQFSELNDTVFSGIWFLFSSAIDSFFSEHSTCILSEQFFFSSICKIMAAQ